MAWALRFRTGAEEAFDASGTLVGAQNVMYFLTNGGPNSPSGSAGINPTISGNSGEETQWQAFLAANQITSFAVGMGLIGSDLASASTGSNNDTIGQELIPIASSSADAIFISDPNRLSSALAATVNAPTGIVTAATSTQLTVTGLTGLVPGGLLASVASNGVSSGAPVQVAYVVPLSITPPTLPAGTVNAAYDQALGAVDGFGVDDFAVTNIVNPIT